MGPLARFNRLAPKERKFLIAAAATLPIVWVRLRVSGLASAQRWVGTRTGASPSNPAPGEVQRLATLVSIAARYVPLPSTCLTRSLALVALLKTQGIQSQLRIGVRKDGAALDAHAWVEYAGIPVNDSPDVAQRFAMFSEPLPLSAFPTR